MAKSKNRHVSATMWPIATKFGTIMHFDPFDPSHLSNFQILKIQDCGSRHLEKSKNRYIWAMAWPIAAKFGTMTHFDPFHPSDPWNFHILKIQHGGGRHLENRKIAISQQQFHRSPRNLVRWRLLPIFIHRNIKPVANKRKREKKTYWSSPPIGH